MTTNKSTKLTYKDINLHVDIFEYSKNAPTIIIIPGTGSYGLLYSEFCQKLSNKGFNVMPFDLMGHGRSGGKRGEFTMVELLRNVSTVVSFARKEYSNDIGLVGTSQGGELAFYAALADKRVKSLICHNLLLSHKFPINFKVKFLQSKICNLLCNLIADFSFPLEWAFKWKYAYNSVEFLQEKRNDPLVVWHYKFKSYRTIFTYNPNLSISEMKTPVLVAVGENDKLVPLEHCKKAYDALTCQKEFYVMPGAKHQLLIDYSDRFVPIVDCWFKKTLDI